VVSKGGIYNRQVICGYVSGERVKEGYELVVRRINQASGDKHKVTVSALVGKLIERMLPFLLERGPAAIVRWTQGGKDVERQHGPGGKGRRKRGDGKPARARAKATNPKA